MEQGTRVERGEYEKAYQLEDWYWWFVGKRRLVASLLHKLVSLDGAALILDVGCGTGGMTAALLSDYGRVSGVDLSPTALGFCRRRGLSNLCQASALRLPFADRSFALITVFDVLYHLGNDVAALREVWRVCRPGGSVLLTDPAFEFLRGPHDLAYDTRRRYTASQIRRKLEATGFRVQKASYANAFLSPVVFAVRRWKRIFPTAHRSDLRPLPRWLNRILATIYGLEARVIPWVDLPVGSSVVCVARKPS